MNHKTLMLILIGALASSTAYAQTTAEIIDRALAAAPNFMGARERTAVIAWNDDHTYETLKEGTTNIACYDRSGEPGRPAFAVQCTSIGNLERVAQTRHFEAETADEDALNAMIEAAEADGTRVVPQFGGVWIAMNGDDQASANAHATVAVPGATGESIGLPESPGEGGAWVMAAGTTAAHIMIPGS
jgi:hypothetical protein